MSYLNEFLEIIESKNYHDFLKLWEEYCYSDKIDDKEFIDILTSVKNSSLAPSFGHHVEKAISLLDKIESPQNKDLILKLILDIQTTNTDNFANLAYNYLKEKFSNDKFFAEKIRLIGLRDKQNFQGAISKYELLNHLEEGNFVFHTAGWGTGEIMDLSLIREELSLEFEYVIGKRSMSFQKAIQTMIPLSKDHFLARRFGDPDSLEAEAKKDPIKVISLLLKDLGPKTAIEIKEELCELVIPESDWNKWWQNARAKIKKSTKIQTPSDHNLPFKLRKEDVSHENSLYLLLEKKPDTNKTLQLVYSFLRDFPEILKNQEFKKTLHTKLTDILSFENISPQQKIQIYFLLIPISNEEKYQSEIKEIINQIENIKSFLEEIEIISFKKKTLNIIKKIKENWEDLFINELFEIPQTMIRDFILEELKKACPEKLSKKLTELLKHPTLYPDVFVWFFQKIIKPKNDMPLSDPESLKKFFEGYMIILDYLYNQPEKRPLMKKMTQLIVADRYKLVRNFMKIATLPEVKEFLLLSTKCMTLSDQDIQIIQSLGEVVYPQLKSKKEKGNANQNVIWTTKEGYEKVQKQILHLSTVETVKNAQEIEEARSHGDLRENAEYKASLERRDRIQGELQMLSEQLNKAKIITKEDINASKAGVGTIVECKKADGSKITFTILGPWEASPEKNILSFQSKLAQSMLNLKKGDTFNFQNEDYEIINISSYYDSEKKI